MQGAFSLGSFITVVLAIVVLVPYGWSAWVASCAAPCLALAVALLVSVDENDVMQTTTVSSGDIANLAN